MFEVNNKDTRTTIPCSSVSIVNFEHVIAGWDISCDLLRNFCEIFRNSHSSENWRMVSKLQSL